MRVSRIRLSDRRSRVHPREGARPLLEPDEVERLVQEDQIKKEHLRLLIRIKNGLAPEQREELRKLRPKRRSTPGE